MKTFHESIFEDIRPKPLNSNEREVLWSAIEQRILEQPVKTNYFSFTVLTMRMRAVSVVLLLVVFVTGSFAATVAAAGNAKPGDSLFPVQLALENVRIAVTPTSAGKTKLRIAFSQKHLAEVKNIMVENHIFVGSNSATSTATSTPIAVTDKHRLERAVKAQKALTSSIDYLEKVKKDVRSSGTREDIQKVNDLVSQIATITDQHVSELKNVADQSEAQEDQKEHIKAEEMIKELRVKMKKSLRVPEREDDSKDKEKWQLPQNHPSSIDSSRPTSTPKTMQGKFNRDDEAHPKQKNNKGAVISLPDSTIPVPVIIPGANADASTMIHVESDKRHTESEEDDSSR